MTLAAVEREEKSRQAYTLSLRGHSAAEIACILGVSEKTIDNWLKHERARRWAELTVEEKDGARLCFESEQRAIMAEAWTRYGKVKDSSVNTTGLLNTISACSTGIAKARGVFTEQIVHSGSLNLLQQLLETPQQVTVPDTPNSAEFED